MSKRPINPQAREALNQMKQEIANELGIKDVKMGNKGNLQSRQIGTYAGPVGGMMTKKLVEMGEKQLID